MDGEERRLMQSPQKVGWTVLEREDRSGSDMYV